MQVTDIYPRTLRLPQLSRKPASYSLDRLLKLLKLSVTRCVAFNSKYPLCSLGYSLLPRHTAIQAAAKTFLAANTTIPLVPGYSGADQTLETLIKESRKVGYPLLIKASAGGGGKGMRIVYEESA